MKPAVAIVTLATLIALAPTAAYAAPPAMAAPPTVPVVEATPDVTSPAMPPQPHVRPPHMPRMVATPPPVPLPVEGSWRLGEGADPASIPIDVPTRVTMEQAMILAMAYHPRVEGDRALASAAWANARSQESGLFPSVRIDAEANQDSLVSRSGLNRLNGRYASIEASQLLFDGFKAANRSHAARAEHAATEWEFRQNTMQLAFLTARAYLTVMREREILSAALRNLDEHRRAVGRLAPAIRFDPGKEFDLEQIRSREAFAASLVTEREGALNGAAASFREITGRRPGTLMRPTRAPSGEGFASLEQALALGREVNPLIQVALNRYARRTHERQEAEGNLSPRVDLVGRVLKGYDRQGVAGQNDENYVGMHASYVMPLAGGTFLQAMNLSDVERSAAFAVDGAHREVRENVRIAWAQRQAIIDTIAHVKDHYTLSAKVLERYKTQYTLGRRTILDLLIIQNETYQAEARLVGLEYDKLTADYNLAAQVGIIDRFAPLPNVSTGTLERP